MATVAEVTRLPSSRICRHIRTDEKVVDTAIRATGFGAHAEVALLRDRVSYRVTTARRHACRAVAGAVYSGVPASASARSTRCRATTGTRSAARCGAILEHSGFRVAS